MGEQAILLKLALLMQLGLKFVSAQCLRDSTILTNTTSAAK
ncbi:hypothetical protein [Helicobacter sp.]|nr:hypothetical protein [Helicobacter sp.]